MTANKTPTPVTPCKIDSSSHQLLQYWFGFAIERREKTPKVSCFSGSGLCVLTLQRSEQDHGLRLTSCYFERFHFTNVGLTFPWVVLKKTNKGPHPDESVVRKKKRKWSLIGPGGGARVLLLLPFALTIAKMLPVVKLFDVNNPFLWFLWKPLELVLCFVLFCFFICMSPVKDLGGEKKKQEQKKETRRKQRLNEKLGQSSQCLAVRLKQRASRLSGSSPASSV